MKRLLKSTTLMTGFATFSMFFGAGNVVFPLGIGQYAQDKNIFSILGLLITAVGVPLLGLISMTLFHGDYKKFFQRIGDVPGYLFALFLMIIIGPFGASPRTIALSHATFDFFFPGMSLPLFSFLSCCVIFLFTIRPSKIVDILGKVLTPFLLVSLLIIIFIGLYHAPETIGVNAHTSWKVFLKGLYEGYQTMDLLATPFFASIIIACLKEYIDPGEHKNHKKIIFLALKASFIAALLLAAIYIGFSFVAAYHSESLSAVKQEQMISFIAMQTLGSYGALVTCTAVALACLTTAIALSSVFAEYLRKDVFNEKISYGVSLALTLIVTFFVSTLNFTGIVNLLTPVLQILYPVLIVLCLINIFYKTHHFQPVKWPVYTVFILSLINYLL